VSAIPAATGEASLERKPERPEPVKYGPIGGTALPSFQIVKQRTDLVYGGKRQILCTGLKAFSDLSAMCGEILGGKHPQAILCLRAPLQYDEHPVQYDERPAYYLGILRPVREKKRLSKTKLEQFKQHSGRFWLPFGYFSTVMPTPEPEFLSLCRIQRMPTTETCRMFIRGDGRPTTIRSS
jgi:hypothetical protein